MIPDRPHRAARPRHAPAVRRYAVASRSVAPGVGERRNSSPESSHTTGGGLLQRIAAVVAMIPPGRVATYGQVAAQAGNRRAARQVAWALRAYAGRGLPWHRVIGAGGGIRLPAGGGLERQRALLLAEGVAVDPHGRLDLIAYQWRP